MESKPRPAKWAGVLHELNSSEEENEKQLQDVQIIEQAEPAQTFKVEMLTTIVIDNNYMMSSHLGEW